MTNLRNTQLTEFSGLKVEAIRDYESDKRVSLIGGSESKMGLPKANVMYYELENHAWFAARPSGNEPKIKFYFGVNEESFNDAQAKVEEMKACVNEMVDKML